MPTFRALKDNEPLVFQRSIIDRWMSLSFWRATFDAFSFDGLVRIIDNESELIALTQS